MEELLSPVSTAYKPSRQEPDALVESVKSVSAPSRGHKIDRVSSREDVLEILRSEPNFELFQATLQYLVQDSEQRSSIWIRKPSPLAGQIINALVTEILPSYWSILNSKVAGSCKRFQHDAERNHLLLCLRSITGLNAIVMRLKTLIQQLKEGYKGPDGQKHQGGVLKEYLEVLEAILGSDSFLNNLWQDTSIYQGSMEKVYWKEIVNLIAGGRLVNTAAEAFKLSSDTSKSILEPLWIGDGLLFSQWLGRNIRNWAIKDSGTSDKIPWSLLEILSKSLRLGYSATVLQEVLNLALSSERDRQVLSSISNSMSSQDQKSLIDTAVRFMSKKFAPISLPEDLDEWSKAESTLVGAAARYLDNVVDGNDLRRSHMVTWLTSSSGAGIGEGIGIRRSVLAAVARSKPDLEQVFEKSLQQFGDQLYIKHAPILQQEVHTQILLMSAGYIFRSSKMKLSMAMRSGPYLSAISSHLAASSERSKFLGMVVGEALSSLVDKEGKQVKFKIDELGTSEALWYKSLINIDDSVGSIDKLRLGVTASDKKKVSNSKKPISKPRPPHGQSKIMSIEELDDDDEEVEEDLVPYAKPESDAEDSDEDPTLITRNKPTAPVYIRDLITYLRDTDSYDRQKLALTTAPALIRRKINFGTEVTSHAIELATLFVGLQDKYEIPNFHDLRLQSMIAVVLSSPKVMAPWFAKTFFDGDYSLSQRASILTVLSVSARELAGFGEEDRELTTVAPPSSNFPSKQLPPKMHAIYSSTSQQTQAIDALTTSLSNAIITPLAASAADTATGPNILKVRTFSSRLAVEAKRKPPTTNGLAPLSASSYFFPLTARFSAHHRAYGPNNVIFSPLLLNAFLKALSLILHASGPYAPQLAEMTSEYWGLLLAVRMQAVEDTGVAQAVLIGFLTILEVNAEGGMRALVERSGRELVETQKWTDAYFGSLAGGSGEDDRIRSLAAAVLVRIGEVVEKYQILLMGEMGGL